MKTKRAKPKIKRCLLPADVHVSGVEQVDSYLRGHRDLAAMVPAMCLQAREEFGPQAELTIQINHDHEIDDPYLILYVRLPAYAPDTRKRIDAVWQHFEEELSGLSGWIILTTDFRKANGDGI